MPALQVRPHRFGSGGFCWRVGTHNRWLTQQAPLQRVAKRSQHVYWQLHLQEHVARLPVPTPRGGLSRLQRVTARRLEETSARVVTQNKSLSRLPPVVCQALALQAALRLLSC